MATAPNSGAVTLCRSPWNAAIGVLCTSALNPPNPRRGFKIPEGAIVPRGPKLMLANADDVALVPVPGHGPATLFKLLMGTTKSRRLPSVGSQDFLVTPRTIRDTIDTNRATIVA